MSWFDKILLALLCCYYLYLIGLLFTGRQCGNQPGCCLMNISLPPHNKSPMIALWITSRSAIPPCSVQYLQLTLDKAACEEKHWVLSLTFSLSAVVPLLRGLPLFLFAVLIQWPRLWRRREAGEIKPPFALRNFMHYSELQRIISPRQLLRGQWGDNC